MRELPREEYCHGDGEKGNNVAGARQQLLLEVEQMRVRSGRAHEVLVVEHHLLVGRRGGGRGSAGCAGAAEGRKGVSERGERGERREYERSEKQIAVKVSSIKSSPLGSCGALRSRGPLRSFDTLRSLGTHDLFMDLISMNDFWMEITACLDGDVRGMPRLRLVV